MARAVGFIASIERASTWGGASVEALREDLEGKRSSKRFDIQRDIGDPPKPRADFWTMPFTITHITTLDELWVYGAVLH